MFKFQYNDPVELLLTLKQLKQNYHLSNRTIAAAIGTTESTMSNWLNGKTKISQQMHDKVEDYIAQTWKPALICVEAFGKFPRDIFWLVGDKYDPWYTWIHNPSPDEAENKNDLDDLILCERACKTGQSKLHIVKEYPDLDTASREGRDEEHMFNAGAMTGRHIKITFFGSRKGIYTRYAPLYNPKTEQITYYDGDEGDGAAET